MTEELHEMLAFVLENEVGLTAGKARSLASYFSDIGEFLSITEDAIANIRGIGGKRTIKLSEEEINKIIAMKELGYLEENAGSRH